MVDMYKLDKIKIFMKIVLDYFLIKNKNNIVFYFFIIMYNSKFKILS